MIESAIQIATVSLGFLGSGVTKNKTGNKNVHRAPK
jgi:hypothetical protein